MSRHSFSRGFGGFDRPGGGDEKSHFGGARIETDFRDFRSGNRRMAGNDYSMLPNVDLQHDRDRGRRDNPRGGSDKERDHERDTGDGRKPSQHQSSGNEHDWIDKFLKERNRDRLRSKFLELSDKAKERRLQREINESLADLWTALERGLPLDFNSREHDRHNGNLPSNSHGMSNDLSGSRPDSASRRGSGEYAGGTNVGGDAVDYGGSPAGFAPGDPGGDGSVAQPSGGGGEYSATSALGDTFGGVIDSIKAKASDVSSYLSGSIKDLLSVASKSVGQPMWVNSPVDVAGGVYGCAATISELLIQGGSIDRGEYNASVSGLESLLSTPAGQPTPEGTTYTPQLGKGWVRVDGPVPGAVVCGYREPRPAFNGGAHIGIVGPDGTTVFNNHSDSRVLAEDPISAFNSGEYPHDVAYYVPAETLKKQTEPTQETAQEPSQEVAQEPSQEVAQSAPQERPQESDDLEATELT